MLIGLQNVFYLLPWQRACDICGTFGLTLYPGLAAYMYHRPVRLTHVVVYKYTVHAMAKGITLTW